MKSIASILLGLLAACQVSALPGGAPSQACNSMTPSHGFAAQSGPTPFVTLPQATSVNGDGSLALVLQSSTSATFKGFLVMAFDESGSVQGPIGTFSSISDGRTLSCSSGLPNAATHSNRNQKSSVTLQWTPPPNFVGSVFFKTTFVQARDTFWVAVPSTSVRVLSTSSEAVPVVTTTPSVPSTTPFVPPSSSLSPVAQTTSSAPSTTERQPAPPAPVTSAPKLTGAAAALLWSPSALIFTALALLLSSRF